MTKEEAMLPTFMMDAIFITNVINAKEDREVAFLHADKEEDMIMFIKGILAELIMMVASQPNQKYEAIEGGQNMLYVKYRRHYMGC